MQTVKGNAGLMRSAVVAYNCRLRSRARPEIVMMGYIKQHAGDDIRDEHKECDSP
jgi:hypothetical protein